MSKTRSLISAFNLYKGGSLALFLRMENAFQKNPNVVCIKSAKMGENFDSRDFSIPYPIKHLNSIYRFFLEQFFIPLFALITRCDHLVMMGNIASIFWLGKQTVYFHNTLYLDCGNNESYAFRLEKLLFYTSIRLKKPRVLVQSTIIADKFRNRLPCIINLHVIGVPSSCFERGINKRGLPSLNNGGITLLYPAFAYPHKNHKILTAISNFLVSANIKILLTISEADAIANKLDSILFNSSFVFLGNQSGESMKSLYKATDGLIFLSLEESLGMPLIEATEFDIPIIAPNLAYTEAAIENYYSFDPLNADSLILAIKSFLHDVSIGVARRSSSRLSISPAIFLKELIS